MTGPPRRGAVKRQPAQAAADGGPETETTVAEPLTLINAFEVPGEQAEQFIAAWEKTRDYLETRPGYVDTALHQAVMPAPISSS
jgi:hypothetical protein